MKKMLKISSLITILAGMIMIGSGSWGLIFTHNSIKREKITTHSEASIPNVLIAGPLTLKSQADVIRVHTLRATGGKTFAETPTTTPRDIWITALTLTTALNFGILAYILSGAALLLGLVFIWIGIAFFALSKKNF